MKGELLRCLTLWGIASVFGGILIGRSLKKMLTGYPLAEPIAIPPSRAKRDGKE